MKPVNFEYARPADLSAAIALGGRTDAMVKFIAGGQSLGPMLNLRLVQPDLLVDITAIAELKRVEQKPDVLFIGSCVTHADIEDGRVPDVTSGAMRAVAAGIAYRAVRNRGTIGGSLVHADPAADWMSALAALGAQAVVRGPQQERRVPVETLMTGVFECSLAGGEMLTGIEVDRLSSGARWGYYKHSRKTGEFAHAIGAYLHDPGRSICRAVIGATGSRPIVFNDAFALVGDNSQGAINRVLVESAMAAHGVNDPIDQQIHFACLRRAIEQARPSMTTVSLIINGRATSAEAEPRTHLADFLRETQTLTGTHLGCEHGVCGACTVLVDGVPVRSCITYAVACGGASVTTIEGLDDDEISKELRAVFAREHALQCGYCTPGMLISARDLVLRALTPIRAGDPRRDERQPLPLHWLCRHYCGRSKMSSPTGAPVASPPYRAQDAWCSVRPDPATARRSRQCRVVRSRVASVSLQAIGVGNLLRLEAAGELRPELYRQSPRRRGLALLR